MRDELKHITLIRAFAVILVVLGHSFIRENGKPPDGVYQFIYSFHMPLFFAISGYLLVAIESLNKGYKVFMLQKAKRLLIPYTAISSLAYLPKTMLSVYAYRPIELDLGSFILSIFYPTRNSIYFFWFLPTLFLIFSLSPILVKMIKKKIAILFASVVLIFLYLNGGSIEILNLSGVLQNTIFFWSGMLLASYKKNISSFLENRFFMIGTTMLSVISSQYYGYNNSSLSLFIAMVGVVMSFSIGASINQIKGKMLKMVANNFFYIYLWSWFFQVFVEVVFYKIYNMDKWFVSSVMFIGGLVGPILLSQMVLITKNGINKIKVLQSS